MNRTKKLWVTVLVLLLVAVVLALVLYMTYFVIIDFHFYPKDAQTLDLRGQEISIAHFEAIRSQIPDCEIHWDIPFQGTTYPDDTKELTVTNLTEEDVAVLDYFQSLQTVRAEQCTDYAQLLELQRRHPEAELIYQLELNGKSYSRSVTEVTLDGIAQEEISLLDCLPKLKTVVVSGGEAVENFAQLQEYCHENALAFCIEAGGETVADDAKKVSLGAVTDSELNLLQFLPEMEELHIVKPEASAEKLVQLRETYGAVAITWEQEIWGKVFASGEEEIDLSDAEIGTLDQVEAGMAYFPDAQQVFLGECGIDNEEIAAYRERAREDYKVVWIVRCGEKLPTRTDATSFMPSRDGVGYFRDNESYNLRYCEDLIAIDVGHMGVKDISFVAYMPNLKYLILAHTEVQDITPISNCKNLIFLELDWSPIKDYTPLQGCTALEDLNIGMYGADVTPICEMTWLKNVWCVFRPAAAGKLAQALPDTKVVASGNATVSSGWRNLPNYYAMRDALGMYYMSW